MKIKARPTWRWRVPWSEPSKYSKELIMCVMFHFRFYNIDMEEIEEEEEVGEETRGCRDGQGSDLVF